MGGLGDGSTLVKVGREEEEGRKQGDKGNTGTKKGNEYLQGYTHRI